MPLRNLDQATKSTARSEILTLVQEIRVSAEAVIRRKLTGLCGSIRIFSVLIRSLFNLVWKSS